MLNKKKLSHNLTFIDIKLIYKIDINNIYYIISMDNINKNKTIVENKKEKNKV